MAEDQNRPRSHSATRRHARREPSSKGRLQSHLAVEAIREQQAKNYELRQAKRARLDGRHEYILSTVAEKLDMRLEDAEEFMLDGDQLSWFESFFSPGGRGAMLFYYTPPKPSEPCEPGRSKPYNADGRRLWVTDGTEDPFTGTCLFFIKQNAQRAVTALNIHQELHFGMLDCKDEGLLGGMELLLDQVFVPALSQCEKLGELTGPGAHVAKQAFLTRLSSFISVLANARASIGDTVKLSPCSNPQLAALSSPADIMGAAGNAHLVEAAEACAQMWCKEIKQILTESEQMRKEADDVGPQAELEHWKKRMAKFDSLATYLRCPQCRMVLNILAAAKSKVLESWRQLDMTITDFTNEAKDNVKFLYTLQKYCEPLYKCNPVTMLDSIPGLINTIRMINSYSRYYNTSERMTALFVKVTNQMITACRAHITDSGYHKVWEQERAVVLARMADCKRLNDEYQKCFQRTKKRLEEHPDEKPFDFSEMYMFGKFNNFCIRLEKLTELLTITDTYMTFGDSHIEGIDILFGRFTAILSALKKKPYDPLDQRKADFDYDFEDFKKQVQEIQKQLQTLLSERFAAMPTTIQALDLLERFKRLQVPDLNLLDKYKEVVEMFVKDLQFVQSEYNEQKENPPLARNLPPISGKITWSRQLYHRITGPIEVMKKHPDVMEMAETKKAIKGYNRLARVLVEYEMVLLRVWSQQLDQAKGKLNSPLLIRDVDTKLLSVNLCSATFELLRDIHVLTGLGVAVPSHGLALYAQKYHVLETYNTVKMMLEDIGRVRKKIIKQFETLMTPYLEKLDEAISPGLTVVQWLSLDIGGYIGAVKKALGGLELVIDKVNSIHEHRIMAAFAEMLCIQMCVAPIMETLAVSEFEAATAEACSSACKVLSVKSEAVRGAVVDIVHLLLRPVASYEPPLPDLGPAASELSSQSATAAPGDVISRAATPVDVISRAATPVDVISRAATPVDVISRAATPVDVISRAATPGDVISRAATLRVATPGATIPGAATLKRKHTLYLKMKQEAEQLVNSYEQQHADTLVQLARLTLETLRRRVAVGGAAYRSLTSRESGLPLFQADIVLNIPSLGMKPLLDEVQQGLNRAVQNILGTFKAVCQWRFDDKVVSSTTSGHHSQLQPLGSYYSLVAEHKEVAKLVSGLLSAVNSTKSLVTQKIDYFKKYQELWVQDREQHMKKLTGESPPVNEYRLEMQRFAKLEELIQCEEGVVPAGVIVLSTGNLKISLCAEAKAWLVSYGKAMKAKFESTLDQVSKMTEEWSKRLSRDLKDLDDIREVMAVLKEVRENEYYIETSLEPIEECYSLLQKYHIVVQQEDMDKVDTLRYMWQNVRHQCVQVQDYMTRVQGTFKTTLLTSATAYRQDVITYVDNYAEGGPMVNGIHPREACIRLLLFQTQFDDLWQKFQRYSDGEELFGLPVTPYPDLERIRKELSLLQKLYGLYNDVMDSIDGYYDILWAELDINKINGDLLDFQNKCRKLPKAMKDWQAFNDLKKKIDDFNEICPLLERMKDKAMKERHWKQIESLTKCHFDIESEEFCLKSVMEAPLLQYMEDIEDICISAVKEKDIEFKLKQVKADWAVQSLKFNTFKARGEMLLKGEDTSAIVSLMEDSLMILGSLMSNRYNAPFKKDIQQWVRNLTNTTEILEKWLIVQNLWIYLEAVFVGGDIAKQLPQEAKRFQNIDKSWVKIMTKAHETPNVVQCCVGDETLGQLLPHLLEQLELCQKSLTGYLEKKRLVFPRFFFVSDPALLEILGQASDSHTIQAHLLSVFDNVNKVTFHEKEYDRITHIHSREPETIELEKPVMAQGNVENWLGALLIRSQQSLHAVIRNAVIAIGDPNFQLVEFLNTHPAQIGLLGIQIIWTSNATNALSKARSDRNAMAETDEYFQDMLETLIAITTQDLSKIERIKFETLITIHLHQRDIFHSLVEMRIKSAADFEWLKQSRFYFNEEHNHTIVSITDVDFIYQNEFLGCTERLVITPLTDRCYITLAQALGFSMGGSPAGPAGTGKTETVKDMGRALGKYVVVFNCSDQMDFRGLGRIYKGLAQSGSWGCFDEFNRIELPVLSVAAQQIAVVLMCKKERKPEFIFTDGDRVAMNPEFGLFLTMNPGYAGRQELPENLKMNFRPIAMMVPDRKIIIRVKLASCGFQDNIPLSEKFFTLYKLCEDQLSKQVHYDFGLRNILSVLRTLGAVKRASPQDPEKTIVMRVLRDMNLSKLVDEDEPLFLSLIDDLFPGIQLDKGSYPDLDAAIDNQVNAAGLVNHPSWTLKLIQLFETQRVRHGFMALGPTGTGKTQCIHILMKAMTDTGTAHREMRMNPKAITASEMFGRLDVATNDWTDGIFSTLWRRTHKVKKGEHIWLVLDGPVDAIWIENLNSVLDDNKTLTLANGDRIPMSPDCKLVFEPDNVDNASPATVSRNGMVFMSSSGLDWKPICQGWLNYMLSQKKITQQESEVLMNLFDGSFVDAYRFIKNSCEPKMKTLECNYISQANKLLEGLIPTKDETSSLSNLFLEHLYIFALMWSIGALLELEDRAKLEAWLRQNKKLDFPICNADSGDTMFEFKVDDKGDWIHWNTLVEEYMYPKDSIPPFASILVPNVDNVRMDFLIHTIAKQEKGVLLIGEQGTAKTVIIQGYMAKYNVEEHLSKSLNFSSATVPGMFQRSIESYIDKRVGTTYGPPAGKKLTVFVDDINMPRINEWGDQITNEIVRQLMQMKGFYSLEKPGDFTTIQDVQMMGAMIHPGGGRNDVPPRLKRQFAIFNCTLPSNTSVDKIFGLIGLGYFCEERGFVPEVIEVVRKLVVCTRRVWQLTKVKMLPTPAKFHYIFNLRDLSRIWEGMLRVNSEVMTSAKLMLALWKHEATRVIADRFTNLDDKAWFDRCIAHVLEEEMGEVGVEDEPYFVDFLRDPPEPTGDEPEDFEYEAPKIYEHIPTYPEFQERLLMYLQQYNETVRGTGMDLVFFKDAMVHLIKISRIIRTDRGNALLVGVGGSGKQSLTRLASFIAGYKTFQIQLSRSYNANNLMDDLKVLYRTAGQQGKGITFLFTDNEIKDEGFLEYINNVLSSGEVSNLFARDEVDEICSSLINVMKKEFPKRPPTSDNLYAYFLSRARQNLHVVLCFSPIGEKFRSRSLKFPGLFSGCTMDWFTRWPKDALIAVAQHFIASFEVTCTPEVKEQMVQTMGIVQDAVSESCISYFERFRRSTHVTPKSYLSFLTGYKNIYKERKKLLNEQADRMNTGLNKLLEASESVAQLSKELEVKEKELAIASKEAEKVLVEVTEKATAAEKVKAEVQKVKDKAQAVADVITADKIVAEGKLEAAKPALKEAEDALQTIKPADIATVRKLGKPPHLIMRIMDCVLLLLRRRLDPLAMDPERPGPKPSWGESLKLMSQAGFLSSLQTFPKDTINEETVELLAPYFNMEDYNLENAKKVCGNVAGLCSWTKAMASFYSVNKEVLPLKANLAKQEVRFGKAQAELAEANAALEAKEREVAVVRAMYEEAMRKKQVLIDDAETCRRKMKAASSLIQGLGGEKVRWTQQSKEFEAQISRLVGDVLLASGFLSYCGPFNQEFRGQLLDGWKKELKNRKIPVSDNMNLIDMLTDSVTIAEWNLQGLPNDELSVQNGTIVTKATRYPLLIDPQGQGKLWIKKKEAARELKVTTLNNKYFRNTLEDSLSLGYPLLIEDVEQDLDPALDNVLDKNFIKAGTSFKVKVGDKEVDVMSGFMLYVTTKLPNPSYTPEVYARTSVIDFTVTIRGLEDQLLGRVILTEKQELEAERVKLMEQVTADKRKMKELEDNLLYRLTSTKGSLVDDESLIEVLQTTKTTSEEVTKKLAVAAETEKSITGAREEYRPVATRGSVLYFLIVEMSVVNVMYQTSLQQFLVIFDFSMSRSAKSPVTVKRIANIIEYLTYEAFKYSIRGLYEEHKFLFTLLLTLKIERQKGNVKHHEFQTLIKGGAALDLKAVQPKPAKWITDVTWLNLVELSKLPQFTEILNQIARNDKAWKTWFDAEAPEDAPIPDGYYTLDTFRKLLLIRSWCPDRTAAQARKYIAEAMGVKFAEGVILDMEKMWEESNARVPMICFLSMGSDPTNAIDNLSKKKELTYDAVSMGQGQEVHARRFLQQHQTQGGWVLLQNTHLCLDFLDEVLQSVLETPNVNPTFRLWLTTEVHPKYPINLLQASIKYTFEPPQGVKAGLKRTYTNTSQEQLDYSNLPQWKPLLYCIAFLHTTVQERRKFGPLGWNIPYEYNQGDYNASTQYVMNMLDALDLKKGISWGATQYMIGEIQYGGRVTDDYDKRLLNTYARLWFNDGIFKNTFMFYKGYGLPVFKTVKDYMDYIENLPLVDTPEIFGLHINADITYQSNTAKACLDTMLSIQPKESAAGSGETRESVVSKQAAEMLAKLPANYLPHEVRERLKKMGSIAPMNIFLKQEIDRMQRVITLVRNTLQDLQLAIEGTIIMSENLRDALDCIYDAKVPKLWGKISWESTTIGFWYTDLLERDAQFRTWIFDGRPNVFWMTGFFNPQGFITAMRQEVTRAHKGWALDGVVVFNEVTKMSKDEVTAPPPEGVYIHGLFLDGAGWDRRNARLCDATPKVLFTMLPVIHIYAINSKDPQDPKLYVCPVYKKPRRTDLTYITALLLKTVQSPDYWILRGVALLCDTK